VPARSSANSRPRRGHCLCVEGIGLVEVRWRGVSGQGRDLL